MFNLKNIKPAFTKDNYGLTQTLLSYDNGETDKPPSQIQIDYILEQAYQKTFYTTRK